MSCFPIVVPILPYIEHSSLDNLSVILCLQRLLCSRLTLIELNRLIMDIGHPGPEPDKAMGNHKLFLFLCIPP